jgi:hypothetical protein
MDGFGLLIGSVLGAMVRACSAKKKTGVVEHIDVFDHAGLLI